jgi:nicotinate phosphoribosyltransferase
VLADWQEEHDGNLRIILPDTYGTEGFLKNAPDWLAGWTGIRIDSGDPATGAETRSAGGRTGRGPDDRSWSSSRTGWTSRRSKSCTPASRAG